MNFLFLKTSLARLEPEIEQFEVRSTFVGFFAICLVAQGDRQLANDDEGAFVSPNLMRQLVLVLRLVMMMIIITIINIINIITIIITIIIIGLVTAALVLLLYEIQQMLTELQTALSQVLNELQRFLKKENSPKFNGQDDGHFILGPVLKV